MEPFEREIEIVQLLVSPIHRYDGRPADGPRPIWGPELVERAEVRAGLGLVGDRYFGFPAHRQAAVTIMAIESVERLVPELGLDRVPDAAATRRNVMLRGLEVDALRGHELELDCGEGTVLFRLHRPANPCAWMNGQLAPGAHRALLGHGGMRSEPLSSGVLRLGPATARVRPVSPLSCS